jgi:hypothetical protein
MHARASVSRTVQPGDAGHGAVTARTRLTAGAFENRYGEGHGALLSHRRSSAGAGVGAPVPVRPLHGANQILYWPGDDWNH